MCPTPTLPPAPAALPLPAYRAAIALDEPFGPDAGHDPEQRTGSTMPLPAGSCAPC
ncbi:hypothetical protein [Streptomyces europaeiscabiei]|uniref:hypothetical protein n=1 Tax=Streptomyces europaeiscabiei TaxID=146819 RepID=UPI002E263D1F|nr:hypothetical protein OG858_45305 [Streptomyces europaeiscabiei]